MALIEKNVRRRNVRPKPTNRFCGRSSHRLRELRLVGLLAAVTLFVAACATTTPAPPKTSSNKLPSVTIGAAYTPNLGSAAALAAALHMGYFKAQGLIVHAVPFQSAPLEFAAMQAGNVQFLAMGPGAMSFPMKGLGAKYLFSDNISLSDAVIGNKADGVTTPASLAGKDVLLPIGTTAQIILLETLHLAGLPLSAVHIVNSAPDESITGFLANSAPAMAGWAPNTTEVLTKDSSAVTLASDRTFYPKVALASSWGVSSSYAAQHPEVVKRFVTAMLEGATYRTEHMSNAVAWVSQMTGTPQQLNAQSIHDWGWFTGRQMVENYTSGKVQGWMQLLNKFFVEAGIMPKQVPFASYSLADVVKGACAAARSCPG